MGTRTKWFLPDKEPLCDALVVTDKGKKYGGLGIAQHLEIGSVGAEIMV